MSIFQEIFEANKNKIITPLASRLSKRFRLTNSADLGILIELSYIHYALDETDAALQLADLISPIEFANNFDIWTWVEVGLALQSAIYRGTDRNELSKKCFEKIFYVYEQGSPTNKKVFNRNLNGALLKYGEIANAKTKKAEYEWRMYQLQTLTLIREMGGGEEFTIERADNEILENKEKLKTLIKFFNR